MSLKAVSIISLIIGPQRNKIEQILQGVDWRVLANQLDLTDEVASIDGACQNLECKLREVVNRFINRQDLEPCHMTVEKIARALETLPKPLTKIPAELRNVCSPTGRLHKIEPERSNLLVHCPPIRYFFVYT